MAAPPMDAWIADTTQLKAVPGNKGRAAIEMRLSVSYGYGAWQ